MWLASILLFTLLSTHALALSCPGCGFSPCQAPKCCDSGALVSDVCGCCKVCARDDGKTCGGPWRTSGTCGLGLSCLRSCQCGTIPSEELPSQICVFPFKYKGNSYNTCIKEDAEPDTYWCATKVNDEGEVVEQGDCNHNCPLIDKTEPIVCDEGILFNSIGVCVSSASAREAQEPGKLAYNVTVDEGAEEGHITTIAKCQNDKERHFCRCIQESVDYESGKACQAVVGSVASNGFCFLENIENPSDPTKFCFTDTAWSAAHGRFYSNLACEADHQSEATLAAAESSS